jgi:hypothetical protein
MAKVVTPGGKVATRLPSTGVKAAKGANHMENGAAFAAFANLLVMLGSGAGGAGGGAARGQDDHGDHAGGQGDHAFAQYWRQGDQDAHVDGEW